MSAGTTPRFALTGRFERAVAYATNIHASQIRKATDIPYMSHLLGVASLVLENGAQHEDEVIGALLHDAAEDQGGIGRLEDIRARFGEDVARIVDGCTDTYDDPKPAWRPRKEAYITRVREHVSSRSADAILRVSLADKVHNARAILADVREAGDVVYERFTGKKEGTLWYYSELAEAFGGFPNRMVDELARVVAELHSLARG